MWTTPAELATYLNTNKLIMSTSDSLIVIVGLVLVLGLDDGKRVEGGICYLPAPA